MKQITQNNTKTGKIGEDLACLFLMKRGFKILERNYWKKYGEIDIICKRDGRIHFVEVKCVSWETRYGIVSRETSNNGTIRPEEHVTREKLHKLSRVVQVYLNEKHVSHETPFQIDVVAIVLNLKDKRAQIKIIENVL